VGRIDNARAVLDRLGLWPLRVLWLLVPVTAGATLATALDDTSSAFALTAAVGLWVAWAMALVALLVPLPATLTAVRILVPAALAADIWALATIDARAIDGVGLAVAGLATVGVLLAPTGDAFVDGASYGAERRFGLRIPAALLLGPAELAWAVVVAGAVAGPLLLACGLWGAGAVALLIGWPAAILAGRALHGLHRRWLVFVPAGVVVHDLLVMNDPVLLARRSIASLGPADQTRNDRGPADPPVSFGLALAVALSETIVVASRSRRVAELHEVDRLVIAPARPGAVLREAADRGLPVG
jgi:hypothetical protein